MTLPKPALSYEDMWQYLKEDLAAQVTSNRTPQAVFNLRELMADLERQRVAPLVTFVKERAMDRKFDRFARAAQ